MQNTARALIRQGHFLALFFSQFFGILSYSILRFAVISFMAQSSLNHFQLTEGDRLIVLSVTLLLPIILFSGLSGKLGDMIEKSFMYKILKAIELIIISLICISFKFESFYVTLFLVFCLGIQSTFADPLKFSILYQNVSKKQLVSANGIILCSFFITTILASLYSDFYDHYNYDIKALTLSLIGFSVLGLLAALALPKNDASNPKVKYSLNPLTETMQMFKSLSHKKELWLTIFAISWFWSVVYIFFIHAFNLTNTHFINSSALFLLFVEIFTAGIVLGGLVGVLLLKGRIEAVFVPISALLLSVFLFDLSFSICFIEHIHDVDANHVLTFFNNAQYNRVFVDIFMIAFSGGLYVIPLYALLQSLAKRFNKTRVMAANKLFNALFVVLAIVYSSFNLDAFAFVDEIIFVVSVINLVVLGAIFQLLPGRLVKSILRTIFTVLYRVEVSGLDNYRAAGDRAVIIPNHTSFLDGLLLAAYLPDNISFALHTTYFDKWWTFPIKNAVTVLPIDTNNPLSVKTLISHIKTGNRLVIFPEGRITVTGALMKVYEGPGLIAIKADAVLLPIYIDGAHLTHFSKLKHIFPSKLFPKIRMMIHSPSTITEDNTLSKKDQRAKIGLQMYDIMVDMMYKSYNPNITLFKTLVDIKNIVGGNHPIIEESGRDPLTYKRVILGSLVLGQKFKKISQPNENIGIMLPNTYACVLSFFGLSAIKRIPAMLNFSMNAHSLILCVQTAKIKTVLTSRKFIQVGNLQHLVKALSDQKVQVVYLEDVKKEVSIKDKLSALFLSKFTSLFLDKDQLSASNQPAVILFTSGSEGVPKAVLLSHRNLQANRFQISCRLDYSPSDVVLNVLPMFHSFGLSTATIAPILSGVKVFLYPSPLHYQVIPELSYACDATILFGTNTFLSGYARSAHNYDFYSIRYVFAGAEPLTEDVRQMWLERFGIRIFEGYGATETGPVLSMNTPMYNQVGTVGQLLPHIEHRLEPVPGIEKGGQLWVRGPNVMLGYYMNDNPGVMVSLNNGWYNTGDVVTIDEKHFVCITGRAKRFAKIAGEMISLAYIEAYLTQLWPESQHAVLSVPDKSKGEQLLLLTTEASAERQPIVNYVQLNSISELTIPKVIIIIDQMPLLGSGKVDFPAVKQLAIDKGFDVK